MQYGDVARLASGRLVARCQFRCLDATVVTACREYDTSEKPETATRLTMPTDWGRWIDEEMGKFPGAYSRLGPEDFVPAREREYLRFQREWPHIAAELCVAPTPAKTPRFDFGAVFYPARNFPYDRKGIDWAIMNPRLWHDDGGAVWRELLEQHAAGSFGLFGEFDDVPLTEEEHWTLSDQPVCLANKAAIAATSGAIRSRFALPDAQRSTPAWPPMGAAVMAKQAVVDVVTVLAASGPRTLMTPAFVDVDS